MKYYIDTEFIEDGRTIDLISIAIASEDGRSLYLQNAGCEFTRASDWVWRNVFPHLSHFSMKGYKSCDGMPRSGSPSGAKMARCYDEACPWRDRYEIVDEIKSFCDSEKFGKPEFWGYYADYDWVALCQLFGPMIALPKGFPMYCRDLKQLSDDTKAPEFKSPEGEHNALTDAIWNKKFHEYLINIYR